MLANGKKSHELVTVVHRINSFFRCYSSYERYPQYTEAEKAHRKHCHVKEGEKDQLTEHIGPKWFVARQICQCIAELIKKAKQNTR